MLAPDSENIVELKNTRHRSTSMIKDFEHRVHAYETQTVMGYSLSMFRGQPKQGFDG